MKQKGSLTQQAAEKLGCKILYDEPMSAHTTFKIGGPAELFITVENERQLGGVIKAAKEEGLPYFILGNGSNLLVSDLGIKGAVIYPAGDFKKIELMADGRTIKAGAGATLASLCAFAREKSLTGLEFAWGIPGTVGGAAYMNAGAYDGEMKDVVTRVKHMTPEGEKGEAAGDELEFAYRSSRYTGKKDIITGIECAMVPGDHTQIAMKMEELMAKRKDKQPYDMPSAGSIFKRPPNAFAAALIDQCGLKGKTVGGAQVSEKHAGFIVNRGGATCKDVLELIELVQKEVMKQTGTMLECEVRKIGQ